MFDVAVFLVGTMLLLRGINITLLTKITAVKNVALSYHKVRGLYFLAVIFAVTIVIDSLVWTLGMLRISVNVM